MLLELSVVEQRYQAVLAVIRDGVPIVEVAHRFDVSRQAVHRWLRWYEAQGLPGLADRSHRPPRCSHQMDASVEVWVLEARRRNPDWGPRRLVQRGLKGTETLDSASRDQFVLMRPPRTSLLRTRSMLEASAGGFGGESGARRSISRCGRFAL
jgi:transposase-like protein